MIEETRVPSSLRYAILEGDYSNSEQVKLELQLAQVDTLQAVVAQLEEISESLASIAGSGVQVVDANAGEILAALRKIAENV